MTSVNPILHYNASTRQWQLDAAGTTVIYKRGEEGEQDAKMAYINIKSTAVAALTQRLLNKAKDYQPLQRRILKAAILVVDGHVLAPENDELCRIMTYNKPTTYRLFFRPDMEPHYTCECRDFTAPASDPNRAPTVQMGQRLCQHILAYIILERTGSQMSDTPPHMPPHVEWWQHIVDDLRATMEPDVADILEQATPYAITRNTLTLNVPRPDLAQWLQTKMSGRIFEAAKEYVQDLKDVHITYNP